MHLENKKWIQYNDTLVCPKCGYGYFPTESHFKSHVLLNDKYIAKYCPECGQNMEVKD